jgi:hypothetical protein
MRNGSPVWLELSRILAIFLDYTQYSAIRPSGKKPPELKNSKPLADKNQYLIFLAAKIRQTQKISTGG